MYQHRAVNVNKKETRLRECVKRVCAKGDTEIGQSAALRNGRKHLLGLRRDMYVQHSLMDWLALDEADVLISTVNRTSRVC